MGDSVSVVSEVIAVESGSSVDVSSVRASLSVGESDGRVQRWFGVGDEQLCSA